MAEQLRKGHTVRLRPDSFLMQTEAHAKVQFIYRGMAHIKPALNGFSSIRVGLLERVKRNG